MVIDDDVARFGQLHPGGVETELSGERCAADGTEAAARPRTRRPG
jgi:hypothetical protein